MGEIRVGRISSINNKNGMVRVTYADRGESTTIEMPCINGNGEYFMPKVGESVIVAHLSNGSSRGVVLGTIWNKNNRPPESGTGLYRKDLSKTKGAAIIRYSDSTGEYLIKTPRIKLNAVNEAEIASPRINIKANKSIGVSTEELSAYIDRLELTTRQLSIGNGEKEGERLEIDNNCDIDITAIENEITVRLKNAFIKIIEDIEIETGSKITITGRQAVELKADNSLILEDKDWSTSLGEIMQRLAALDGSSSGRKQV